MALTEEDKQWIRSVLREEIERVETRLEQRIRSHKEALDLEGEQTSDG